MKYITEKHMGSYLYLLGFVILFGNLILSVLASSKEKKKLHNLAKLTTHILDVISHLLRKQTEQRNKDDSL